MRAVAHGTTYIDPSIAPAIRSGAAHDALIPREIDVLRHLALGRSNREIAAALDIGDETVKTHVANVLVKLGVENRAQTLVQAIKQGLVSLDAQPDS